MRTHDITEIRVFHKDRFLCKAINPAHAETIDLSDIRAARRALVIGARHITLQKHRHLPLRVTGAVG